MSFENVEELTDKVLDSLKRKVQEMKMKDMEKTLKPLGGWIEYTKSLIAEIEERIPGLSHEDIVEQAGILFEARFSEMERTAENNGEQR